MARQIFDIFLSSTSKDLQPHRAKVAEMVDRLRQTSIRMETFGARHNKPLSTCREEVLKCDALVVIVGHRYGWVPGEEEGGDGKKSITWWEVHWALQAKKPVYAFLVAPDANWSGEREQDRLTTATTKAEFIEIGTHVQQLRAFREFLGKRTTHEHFSSAEDLGGKVATSLHLWLFGQTTAAARAALPESQSEPAIPTQTESGKPIENPIAVEQTYWQEQIHLLSARRASLDGKDVRIALIAGRANTDHPALVDAAIRQFDVRSKGRTGPPDDFTTAVAALIVGNDAGSSYAGVIPHAHLTILQVLDSHYSVTNTDVAVAVDAAIREGAHVICLPLGGQNRSEADSEIYSRAAQLGIVVVCPAGNDANDQRTFPAGYDDCLAAASIDGRNELAYFSSFGDWVTTSAPGVDLPVAVGNNGYQQMSGTAFSCAIAAGIAALMKCVNRKLSLARAREIIQTVGTPVVAGEAGKAVGSLRVLDAAQALALARASIPKPAKRTPSSGKRRSPSRRRAPRKGPALRRQPRKQ